MPYGCAKIRRLGRVEEDYDTEKGVVAEMKQICGIVLMAMCGCVSSGGLMEECPVSENVRGHENVEWSIAYAYGLTDAAKDLPRVLLVGDSICQGYQEGVRERLKGRMNVSYWISSYCVTSPAYMHLLSVYLDETKYDVIHFNNGLHSLGTPIDAYKDCFRTAIELIHRRQPQAKIVWCSSTPLKDAEKTAKCQELNAAAAQVVEEFGDIATNDLFALLNPLDREENWSDVYHHKPPLCAKEAEEVVNSVLTACK